MQESFKVHSSAIHLPMALLVSAALLAVSLPAHATKFSPKEKSRLKSGETVIRLLPSSGQKGFYGGSGYAVIDAPVEKVWEALRKWTNYTDMFPYTKECLPVSQKGNRTLVKMVIGHPIASVQYHLDIEANEAEKTLRFDLVSNYPHDLDMLKGFWRLFPQPGGRTLAAYVVSAKAPPGLVVLVGHKLAHEAIEMLLSIPGDLRQWMKENK